MMILNISKIYLKFLFTGVHKGDVHVPLAKLGVVDKHLLGLHKKTASIGTNFHEYIRPPL